MWDADTIIRRNQELAEAYLAGTPPRERLRRRLDALDLTNAEETALIMALFDSSTLVVQARLAELDVGELINMARNHELACFPVPAPVAETAQVVASAGGGTVPVAGPRPG